MLPHSVVQTVESVHWQIYFTYGVFLRQNDRILDAAEDFALSNFHRFRCLVLRALHYVDLFSHLYFALNAV